MKNSVQGLRVAIQGNGLPKGHGHSHGHAKRAIAFEQDAGRTRRKTATNGKKRGSYVPPNEQLEMVARRMNGQAINQIATDMGRKWETVARVVKTEEIQAEVERAKGMLVGVLDECVTSFRRRVNTEMDGEMAWRYLERIGAVPPPPPKGQVATPMNGEALIDAYRTRALMQLANVALEKNRIYGSTPPMEREELEKLIGKPPEGQEPLIRDVVKKEDYDPLIFPDEEDDKPEPK
jgi:hypothetical protein